MLPWLIKNPILSAVIALCVALAIGLGVSRMQLSTARTDAAEARTELAEIRAGIAEAGEKARGEAVERDATGENIADTTRTEAQAAVTEQQQTTAAASERVRTIIKTVQVPAECPVTLPPEVQDEGRKAVERANGASR